MRYNWSNIKGALLVAIIFLSVLAVDIGGVFWYYRHVLRFLGDQPEISKADAAVVFFGDYLENGELGPDSKKRAQATFDLYKNNSVNFIICVGGYDYRNWKGRPHAMKNYLCNLGVPSSKIYYDSVSFNTITNWYEACKIIDRNNFHSIVAVSHPLHIYRISRITQDYNISYQSYHCSFKHAKDYWVFYKDVHHEWLSTFLDYTVKDRVRNQMVYIFRTIMNTFKNIF